VRKIYTNENLFLVGNAKNIVEESGIEVILKNEYAAGGSGELSPLDTWPELWVIHDADYEKAMELLEGASEGQDGSDWRCSHCQEMNGARFELCWKCGHENA